jgi:(E)-4-hydroxy-3-methylbut-2-enyl-diphosphate synthase
VLELAPGLTAAEVEPSLAPAEGAVVLLRRFGAADGAAVAEWAGLARRTGQFLAVDAAPSSIAGLAAALKAVGDNRLIVTCSGVPPPGIDHAVGAYRGIAEELRTAGIRAPMWIRNTAGTAVRGDNSFLSRLIEASFLTGSLLCDGVGDLVSIETEHDPARAARLTYNVLQGAGARISKAELVACPSCGRTLFDLQATTQRIRTQTAHLKGVKIAIMGCIVNGPGEMADADFGYVGGAPGKINLYFGKQCVQYNIPQAEADARLIALIKEHKKWTEPEPAHA